MFHKKQTDVCVIGAGPAGLVAAHALSDRHIDFLQIDAAIGPNTHSYALALLPETLEIMDKIGVADEILKRALRVPRIAVYEGGQRKAELDYKESKLRHPHLTVLPQSELEDILIDSLRKKGHRPLRQHRARFIEEFKEKAVIQVDRLMEGMTGYAYAHIETQIEKCLEFTANYVIGADGAHSAARRVSGITFEEVAPSQSYAVFEFKTDADLPDEMRIIVDSAGTHIFWPMPNNCCRWSFEVNPKQVPVEKLNDKHCLVYAGHRAYPLLDDSHLAGFLSEHAQWFKGSVDSMHWRMLVRFEKRLVDSFGSGRIWLAGDAAHLNSPGGMLSMNMGIQEAYDLVERLALKPDNARQAGLASYSDDRTVEWLELLDFNHTFSDIPVDPWLFKHQRALGANLPASNTSRKILLENFTAHAEAVH